VVLLSFMAGAQCLTANFNEQAQSTGDASLGAGQPVMSKTEQIVISLGAML
jgi:hypothetical protein